MSSKCNIDEVKDAVDAIGLAAKSIDASTKQISLTLDALADRVEARIPGRAKTDRPIGHYVRLARQELGVSS